MSSDLKSGWTWRRKYWNLSETWCNPGSYSTSMLWKFVKGHQLWMHTTILWRIHICFQIITVDASKEQDGSIRWYSWQKKFTWVIKTNLTDFHILQTYVSHFLEPSIYSLWKAAPTIRCVSDAICSSKMHEKLLFLESNLSKLDFCINDCDFVGL